jgi:predicted aspartyl protease
MPAYDAVLFDPPAPVAYVTLRNGKTGAVWSEVPMLLDTGADVTLVPRQVIDRVGGVIVPEKNYELVGFDGTASFASVVRLELLFLDRTFKGQFLLIEEPRGILGRNILNRVPLLLDGPHLTWKEQLSGH